MSFFKNKHEDTVTKSIIALLVVATAFLFILTINEIRRGGHIGQAEDVQNTITVTGTGEATAIPNSARFTVGVVNEAEVAETAQTQSTEEINAIIGYLRDQGVAEENIKTISYNISPQYAFSNQGSIRPPTGERQLVGYEVSQRLEVTTENTDQAGTLLSGVGERGADNVSSLSFVVEDEQALERQAQVNAISDARENARELAEALGVNLASVVGYNQRGGVQPYRLESAAVTADDSGGSATPEIPTGENRLEVEVEVIYEIN